MSYAPPSNTAVDFDRSGGPYTPPLYNAVDFEPFVNSPTIDQAGVEAVGAVGTVTVTIVAEQNAYVTGVEAVGQVGSVTLTINTNPSVTGVSATGAVGTVTVGTLKVVNVTGVSATATLGTVTTKAKQGNGNIGIPTLITNANGSTDGTFIADATLDSRNATLLILSGVRRATASYPGDVTQLTDWPPPIAVNPRKPSDGKLYIIDSLGNNWWIFMHGHDGFATATPGFNFYGRDIGFVAYCMPQATSATHTVQWWGGVTTNLGSWTMYLSAWKNVAGPSYAIWEHSSNNNAYPDENEVAQFQIFPPQTPLVPGSLAYALAIIDNFGVQNNDVWGTLGDYTILTRGTAFFNSMANAEAYKVLSGSPAQAPVWDTGGRYNSNYPTNPHNYEVRVGTIFCFFAPLVAANGGTGNPPGNPNKNNVDVDINGVSATGQVGTVTRTITSTKSVTGVAATSGLGTVGKTVSVNVTGLQASAQLGTVAVYIPTDLYPAPQGVQATGEVGTVTFTISTQATVTGVEATGQVGNITYLGTWNGTVDITGVEATGYVGDVTMGRLDLTINVTGVSATGEVGQLGDPYGVEPVGVVDIRTTATGVAGTGQVGIVTPTLIPQFTGVEATGIVESVSVDNGADRSIAAVGVVATGAVGTVTISISTSATVTGVEATSGVGTVAVELGPSPAGVQAVGAVGDVTIRIDSNVYVMGVEGVGEVGTVTWEIAAAPLGVASTGAVGTVAIAIELIAIGVEATGYVGSVVPEIRILVTGVAAQGQTGTVTTLITRDLALEPDDYLWALRQVENVFAQADEALYAIAREADEEQKQKEEEELYAQRNVERLYAVRDVDQLVATTEPATLTA